MAHSITMAWTEHLLK